MVHLGKLTTEVLNLKTKHIDECETLQILQMMNDEDAIVAGAVRCELQSIANAVDGICERLKNGGRLFYVGAGTSGRIGILDASECPPTFGTDPEMVQAYIAGGETAITQALEGAEDNKEEGENLISEHHIGNQDAVIGITASGRTPYVLGALKKAKAAGALTIGIANNQNAEIKECSDICILPDVGPEVIMGSTRLKSGTSQKLVLNMISTATMVKLGKVYRNLMVDMKPTNEKLFLRSRRILQLAVSVDEAEAETLLRNAGGNIKVAIIMYKTGVSMETARDILSKHDDNISHVLESMKCVK